MTAEYQIPCTEKDLNKVEEIFSNAVTRNLSDSKLNLTKIQKDFHNLLTIYLKVQPSPEDDAESQNLKNKIEKSQLKAIRIKSNLECQRNRVIGEVKTLIDTILEQNLQKIPELYTDEFDFNDTETMSDQFRTQLPVLDQCIQDLLLQLNEMTDQYKSQSKASQKAADAISSFINSNV